MKLFGGKKGDDKAPPQGAAAADDEYYDSPQETVSLSGPRTPPGGTPAKGAPATGATAKGAPAKGAPAAAAAPTAPTAPTEAEDDDEPPALSYGINQAIELMRALPVDQNPELVVQVIKQTLESLKVKVSEIIGDADRKTKGLEDRVATLKRAIGDYEKEIETRKQEIARLEADHKETTSVRARLELAEKAQRAQVATAAATAATSGAKVKTG